VPFLCLYLIWRRKQKSEGAKAEILKSETLTSSGPGAGGQAEKRTSGNAEIQVPASFSAFQLFSVCLLCLLYAATRWLHEANPVWRLTSLLWTLEVIGLTLLTVHLVGGPGAEVRGQRSVVPWSRGLFFPICFFLVAVPWPSGLETFLTQSLMRLDAATTVELLGLFGVPAVQHGNVIEVSSGVVGINEACSGIRSLQAALMLSLFFGELYALSARRRALCVFAGFALAFIFNVGRTLLLTRVAAAKGVGAVAAWHDPAGVTILVGCFLCLWLIARALQKAENRKQKAESTNLNSETLTSLGQKAEGGASVGRCFSFSAFQLFSVFLTAWLLVVEVGTEIWYRAHERASVGGMAWSLHRPAQGSNYHEVEMPSSIRGQFNADEGTHLRWEDDGGKSWQAYYFRWFPAHSLKKRVAILLAKVHGPEKCLPAAGISLKAYLGIVTVPLAGMELAMQHYVFNTEGMPLHVFYGIYEDPTGSTQLANRRQDAGSRVAAALAGSRNYGQRFLEVAVFGCENPEDARARLVRELGKLIKGDS
jgi:exosortase/archaeosortase family protein